MTRLMTLCLLLITAALPVHADEAEKTIAPGRTLVAADSSKQTLAMIEADGKIRWRYKIGPLHDLHVLDNGNILFQKNWTHLLEVNPETNRVVWEYNCKPTEGVKRIEVHAFQRLADGNTMIAESGNARIIEVDPSGQIVKQIKLKVKNPHPHYDTRLARKLENGHYLVAHEGEGFCREYDADGKVVWEYEVPLFDKPRAGGHGPKAWGNKLFSAYRLENGNTLIGTGNGHRVIEVTPGKEIVWMLTADDLEDIELAWVTSLQVLKNGNIIVGNCHAGPNNPQLLEIDRDKKVVWSYNNFELFGNALTNTVVIED